MTATSARAGAPRLVTRDGRVVCQACTVARRPLKRMRGLLGRAELPAGEGLLLEPAPSVHTWLMRFPIDVAFLDRNLLVLDVRHDLRPWRMAGRRGARFALELPAGEAARQGIKAGDQLVLVDP